MKKFFRGKLALFAALTGVIAIVACFGLTLPVNAADCGGVQTAIIECASANDATGSPVVAVLVVVIQILTGLVGVVAIGAFIYAGILYSSANGESSQIAKAKEMMVNTVIGLVIFAAMAVLLNYLIPGGLFTGTSKLGAGGNGLGDQLLKDADLADPSNPSGDTSTITSTIPYSLTLASWNTYVNNPDSKGDTVRSLMSSVDVIGLQEVHRAAQRADIKSIASSSIGVYFAPTPSSGDTHMASDPIVYNKSKLLFISGGYKKLGSTPGLTDRYVVYVRLKIKATGQEFYFANTHLPPGIESGGRPKDNSLASAYQKQMSVLVSTLNQLGAQGLPTFLVGDFNVNFRNDDCGVSWFPCKALRGANMKSSFEITRLSGLASNVGTHGESSRLIDYVFVRTDNRVQVNSVSVRGGTACTNRKPDPDCYNGSDHRPSLARITITSHPTSSAGASGAATSTNISLIGVENFRDLAQLNANLIKKNKVFRSAKLADANSADRVKLANLLSGGVIIDLRTASVRASSPDQPISGVPNINYDVDSAASAAEYVAVFVKDAGERKEFGNAITKIANTDGASLFHCTKGKDRTGWLASMILYIMGANDQQVMTEYLKSREAGSGFTVDSSWLNAALSAARKANNGSIMEYITSSKNGLGVSQETINKLKAKLAP